MAPPKQTLWDIDPHTLAKHEILRRYLEAWLPIMSRWNGRIAYIDGFAGPGRYRGGQEGSPLIAIRTAQNHRQPIGSEVVFLFIEKREDRCAYLKQELAKLSLPENFKVETICGDFAETLTEAMDRLDQQKARMAPAFAFLDPFGFSQTPFSVIQRLGANARCEVLITFMYEAINRFLSLPEQAQNLDRLFGTQNWRGVRELDDPNDRRAVLHAIYGHQLIHDAGFQFVRSFEMLDLGNQTQYFAFFGTHSELGLRKMKAAMWKIDPAGTFRFSDRTDPKQAVLFEAGPDIDLLKEQLLSTFRGKTVKVEDIEAFVVRETAFRETHFKRQVLAQLERVDPPSIEIICAPANRRKGTFPNGTVLRFL